MGNFMVLNLFLALLLNSFNSEELKNRKEVRCDRPLPAFETFALPFIYLMLVFILLLCRAFRMASGMVGAPYRKLAMNHVWLKASNAFAP